MSVIIPAVAFAGTSLYKTVLSELTPILWDPVSLGMLVVSPDITTVSFVFKVWVVEINPATAPFPPRTNTTSLYVVIPTVKSLTSLPSTLDTFAAAPPPAVSELSKFKLSSTLKLLPAETIWKSLRFPLVTDSIIDVCWFIS